ncbi:aldehyde dehydrogenase family protein [Burkholderia vietnamiensis]|jgi:aldehyde dehydrogenase (NAD+)|uniref:aldehyde dehydrogenase family protein n=1 Tax=Burkholderia vietnamiensis TaxID=60552 RepID=UPI0007572AF7|nr:aldehyde dehydrogenase family protein [Burkholderia vietnamiensis]KVE66097.1 aldehyde dehydrogenase [Burkholderia vietnamiensis]KVE73667.1 aldehyde dehydrogenase [Burkholderia vietnamiensis]MBR7973597.1 aldehyde dehydrogenase family protein [Burkholderia vietnamiensis]MBR8356426.1 aldehyde dehydrogenase family protein [Burkholderia vietnamiensis]HDR8963128.1 aldehyde dehydrogenase family protein [Burkholderia vietnamiensis]
MRNALNFYIDGAWVAPAGNERLAVTDPCTELPFADVALGDVRDVDRAVAAAKRAFATFSLTEPAERVALVRRILDVYLTRYDDIADTISREIGAPRQFAREWQAGLGRRHLEELLRTCETFAWQRRKGTTLVRYEPVGVVALITPWNWPMNQIVCKVAPALVAGCTTVLKPSEISPLNATIFAEVLDEAGVPAGVFNLVHGDGPTVGAALCAHPDVDMVSFTGSTRAGVQIATVAAASVKRVHQELGGKSANLLLDDADFEIAVTKGVNSCFSNSGQSCNAPTRMLVPASRHEEAIAIARRAAAAHRVGPADAAGVTMGPVVSDVQFERIQRSIAAGIAEGATLVAGGLGRPDGLERGYYVRPTVFAGVRPDMTIAREEIFGPVLAILPYRNDEDAIAIANDSPYGLAAYVQSTDIERARRVAFRLRAGGIYLNYPEWDPGAPFGGYKQSGNGREYAEWGIEAFLEVKGIVGYGH